MKIVWSAEARRDLRAIRSFIARDSEFYAAQMLRRLIERAERISTAPKRGHRVHEYPELDLREVHEPPYRILYRISNAELEVIAIVHFKRRLGRLT